MLQRSIHSVLEVAWNGCYNITLEKDVVADRHSWKTILSRLWNYCACHAKRGRVTFAPTLESRSPLPPPWVGASATPHQVGANATPVPDSNPQKIEVGRIRFTFLSGRDFYTYCIYIYIIWDRLGYTPVTPVLTTHPSFSSCHGGDLMDESLMLSKGPTFCSGLQVPQANLRTFCSWALTTG